MTQPKPVLDYAGPRPPAGLRLPARSVLSVDLNDDHVIVLETLRGEASAIFAIGFAVITIFTLLFSIFDQTRNSPGTRALLILIQLAEVLLIALVINDTWRKTVLTVRKDGLAVEFFSPLTRRRRIERMPDELVSVRAVDLSAERGVGLGELRILATAGAEIHLFTAHDLDRLRRIESAINSLLAPPTPPGE